MKAFVASTMPYPRIGGGGLGGTSKEEQRGEQGRSRAVGRSRAGAEFGRSRVILGFETFLRAFLFKTSFYGEKNDVLSFFGGGTFFMPWILNVTQFYRRKNKVLRQPTSHVIMRKERSFTSCRFLRKRWRNKKKTTKTNGFRRKRRPFALRCWRSALKTRLSNKFYRLSRLTLATPTGTIEKRRSWRLVRYSKDRRRRFCINSSSKRLYHW